jgi:hypothetical protein
MNAFVDKVTISYLPLQKSDSFLSAVLYCDPSFCILILWLREIFRCVRRLYGCTDRRLRHCSNSKPCRPKRFSSRWQSISDRSSVLRSFSIQMSAKRLDMLILFCSGHHQFKATRALRVVRIGPRAITIEIYRLDASHADKVLEEIWYICRQ